jgi:hypothetical protein
MDLCIKFLLRFDSKNKVLKPYHALFNLGRESITLENYLITLQKDNSIHFTTLWFTERSKL